MQLGVFPLPIFLLPGGVTRLRIFEPRYMRLIKESASGEGFALAVYRQDKPFQSNETAAWVKIVDFESLEDGLLGVTVKAEQLVRLSDFSVEEDGLRKAQATPIDHWELKEPGGYSPLFASTLHNLFEVEPSLASTYAETDFQSPRWVCGRFLEILPIPMEQKIVFYQPASFPQLCKLLETVLGLE